MFVCDFHHIHYFRVCGRLDGRLLSGLLLPRIHLLHPTGFIESQNCIPEWFGVFTLSRRDPRFTNNLAMRETRTEWYRMKRIPIVGRNETVGDSILQFPDLKSRLWPPEREYVVPRHAVGEVHDSGTPHDRLVGNFTWYRFRHQSHAGALPKTNCVRPKTSEDELLHSPHILLRHSRAKTGPVDDKVDREERVLVPAPHVILLVAPWHLNNPDRRLIVAVLQDLDDNTRHLLDAVVAVDSLQNICCWEAKMLRGLATTIFRRVVQPTLGRLGACGPHCFTSPLVRR